MRFAFLAASAAALLIAAPAFATGSPASTNVTIKGNVDALCGVGNQSGGGTRTSPAVVDLGSLVDGNGQLKPSPNQVIGFDNLWCNAPNTLTMTVSKLQDQNSPGTFDVSSFTDYLDMNVGADGSDKVLPTYFNGATSVSSASNGGVLTVATEPAFETGTGQYSRAILTYSLPAPHNAGDRPLAGSYQGTVTITATPN